MMNGGTLFPSNMAIAATGDTTLAYKQGQITAQEALAWASMLFLLQLWI